MQRYASPIDATVLKMIENFGSGEIPKNISLCALVAGCAAPSPQSEMTSQFEPCGFSQMEDRRRIEHCFWEILDHCNQDRSVLGDPNCSEEERRAAEARIKIREEWFRAMITTSGN